MFELSTTPRIFGVPPGVDFPEALIDGLRRRLQGQPPEAMARVQIIVNTRRMARRIRTLFDAGPATLLPRIHLLTDVGDVWRIGAIPDAIPPLRRRLELTRLISALLDAEPSLAPKSALFDLADSLANLMDEMQGEGVSPDAIAGLDITDQSGHWARIQSFLGIIIDCFEQSGHQPDTEARQRLVIEHLTRTWASEPPKHPILVAGSTGSRGATQLLMAAVARLPQGAIILPGFDGEMPAAVWEAMNAEDQPTEDHPQFRFQDLFNRLKMRAESVRAWSELTPANPGRNKVVSLALRPAPVTDQWLRDGPELGNLRSPMADVTLVEAPSQRAEALTIAMRLRAAADRGETAALITPDRTLTRQVTAALDRWGILPDDSAGQPLHLSPPGRFLRHVAALFSETLDAGMLLTLLKHPLTHSGGHRNTHLRLTRELELHLRRNGPPFPTRTDFEIWAAAQKDPRAPLWADWLARCFCDQMAIHPRTLSTYVTEHLARAEEIANGCEGTQQSELWQENAGREALVAVTELKEEAEHGGDITARDYASLFHRILSRHEVRNPDTPHPNVLIWGTLEARVQGADLLILAGLNEGSWPSAPDPDPWLNRSLRHQAGLLLPERRIGLSAHDFQQAVAAKTVWLTRAIRSDDAETVTSRWLNRLINLLSGLPDQDGPAALEAMRDRGQTALDLARRLEQPDDMPPASRPAPQPPVDARPKRLSVTEIKRLIRDPYAIYAKHILRLRPLDPLLQAPDALLRGIVLHDVLESFVRETTAHPETCTKEVLMEKTVSILAEKVPWAETRATWLARLDRVADWFVETEQARRALAHPTAFEVRGKAELPNLGFTLTATADRIDMDESGAFHLYDYKTGSPPSTDEQTFFDKQLLLEAAIAELAGFGGLSPATVSRAVFIGLASGGKEVSAPLDKEPPREVWREFEALITAYFNPEKGYAARRAMHSKRDISDYDQLARFGEWDITDEPHLAKVGP